MLQMFDGKPAESKVDKPVRSTAPGPSTDDAAAAYGELKIGRLVQTVMRRILEAGTISEDELALLQTSEYSKTAFDLQYPVLVRKSGEYDKRRYYSNPVRVCGEDYMLCSQWFEVPANNDRPYLEKWIEAHESQRREGGV